MSRARRLLVDGFHAPVRGAVEELVDTLIEIDASGTITAVTPGGDPTGAERLPEGWLLLPGFVDLHIHAPQYAQLGTALDVPLEDWLNIHTFPLESRFADLAFAEEVYRALVADLLALGTTTALYFATIHVEATNLLADICLELGQRALVGKVAMDHPDTCPDYYRDASPEAAVAGTRAVIEHIRNHPGNAAGLVDPVVTPRFIPSCTDACLDGLGRLAAETGTRVQSHVSEGDWEHHFVAERCGCSDTEAHDRFGLLQPHSVLAHGPHLSASDMELLREREAAVAHCPASNAYFGGAVFPLRAALERGLHVGLGTDISGGPVASVPEAARLAIAASRMLETGTDPDLPAERRGRGPARVDFRTAFHLATRGGGEALGLKVGSFEPGMKFDAIAIDTRAPGGTIRLWPGQTGDLVLEKILYTTSRANVARVWTDGVQRL